MNKPYTHTDDCLDLAFQKLKESGALLTDQDVESLAQSIKDAIDSWFGDMAHLSPSKPSIQPKPCLYVYIPSPLQLSDAYALEPIDPGETKSYWFCDESCRGNYLNTIKSDGNSGTPMLKATNTDYPSDYQCHNCGLPINELDK